MTKQLDPEFDRCILCLGPGPLTFEHLIAESLGGHLELKVLCADCNNNLGSKLVAGIYRDPSIRLAVEQVAKEVPEFVGRIGTERFYFAKTPDGEVLRLSKKGDSERVLPARKDGQLSVQDVREMPATLEGRMKKAGLASERIAQVLGEFHRADNDQPVIVPEIDLVAFKRAMPTLEVDLGHRTEQVDPRLMALIAYEALVLLVNIGIFHDAFGPIRDYIRNGTETTQVTVTAHLVRKVAALHYINLVPLPEESAIRIDIGLFETFVHQVVFRNFKGLDAQLVYEEDLKAGTARILQRPLAGQEWEWMWVVAPTTADRSSLEP